jgi:dipeptidyl aminopeptidase/acylaminoacyl peptidase
MRSQEYPGSEITIDETLEAGSNYNRFIAHYFSEGLIIYALLTIPTGEAPTTGWPVIVFNHGFIQPDEYKPTERYEKYVDAMASQGYIVFRPDYRGHGNSDGVASGGYSSPAYTIDVLNAVASISYFPLADANRIGMWGHSMGGQITLRAMVTTCCLIRAGVIWAGVVAPYNYIITQWQVTPTPPGFVPVATNWREGFVVEHGDQQTNPTFWAEISPNSYLGNISGPLQLHHGTGDYNVPVEMSRLLYSEMLDAGRTVFYYEYTNDDHNIANNYDLAMQRTLEFFDQYVKNP